MYSHGIFLVLHFIRNILPQNSLLRFQKSMIPSVLIPSGALQNCRFFSPFGEYLFRERSIYRLKFQTVLEPCKDLQNTSSIRNNVETGTRFSLCMAVRTQRSAWQSCKIDRCHSWPLNFSSNHIRRWESHFAYETQVALNDTTLLVSEISVFDKKCHTICLTCAHVYVYV